MSIFSHVWERVKGNDRGAKRVRPLKNRSLRMEMLEDRALLSVTTGSEDAGDGVIQGIRQDTGGDVVARDLPESGIVPISLGYVKKSKISSVRAADALKDFDLLKTAGSVQSVKQDLTAAERVTINLADWSSYTTFAFDMSEGYLCLYGFSKGNIELLYSDEPDGFEAAQANSATVRALTVLSNNTARTVAFSQSALCSLNDVLYVGGKTKNDTILLQGGETNEVFTMSQYIAEAAVPERPGTAPKTREVTFDTIQYTSLFNSLFNADSNRGDLGGSMMAFSGVRTVSIDAGDGSDSFVFTGELGAAYNIAGGDGLDMIDFYDAPTGVKIDLGRTSAQSVLSGKITLNGDIESIYGSRFKDSITTAANTIAVNTSGTVLAENSLQAGSVLSFVGKEYRGSTGSDTIKLVGDAKTRTNVFLSGDSQKVSGKGGGRFTIDIYDGAKSVVNMSSLKEGVLNLYAEGNKIKVAGSKGRDDIRIVGDDADVKGGDGSDNIHIEGVNARASGGKGDDLLDLYMTSGQCFLDGGDGNDLLVGGAGSDIMKARSGRNVMIGNAGADKMIGGKQSDLLIANSTVGIDYLINEQEISRGRVYSTIGMFWCLGETASLIDYLGEVSVSDQAKDTIKRGGGKGNLFYANVRLDFDMVDSKPDKGDILFIDEAPVSVSAMPVYAEDAAIDALFSDFNGDGATEFRDEIADFVLPAYVYLTEDVALAPEVL